MIINRKGASIATKLMLRMVLWMGSGLAIFFVATHFLGDIYGGIVFLFFILLTVWAFIAHETST